MEEITAPTKDKQSHSSPTHPIMLLNATKNNTTTTPNATKSSNLQKVTTVVANFVQNGGLTENVKSKEQKRKEAWAEKIYVTVFESLQAETDQDEQPWPLTDAKMAMFIRAVSHLGYCYGSIKQQIIPSLKRINVDRYNVDVNLDPDKSIAMRHALTYAKKYAEEDEHGSGNPFTVYDLKYVLSTMPVDSPDYWRDALIMLFPLMTAARCVTVGHFRDKDIIWIEAVSTIPSAPPLPSADDNDDDDGTMVLGIPGVVATTATTTTTTTTNTTTAGLYKMVINLKVTKNSPNWNKKMIIYGKLEEHEYWYEDLVFIINKFLLERSAVNIIDLVKKVREGSMPGDRLFFSGKNTRKGKRLDQETPDTVMTSLRQVFSHRAYMAGYDKNFFHFHDARAGFLTSIVVKNNISSDACNTLLYKAAMLGGWEPNGKHMNLYFRQAGRHQLSPTSLLTDGVLPPPTAAGELPINHSNYTPETFHHLPEKLVPRWKPKTLSEHFQASMKKEIIRRLPKLLLPAPVAAASTSKNKKEEQADHDDDDNDGDDDDSDTINAMNKNSDNNDDDKAIAIKRSRVDKIYIELCRRILIRYTTDINDLLDEEHGVISKGLCNDNVVASAFYAFFSTATQDSQRAHIRETMIENMEEWAKLCRFREGRPNVEEEKKYTEMIKEEKDDSEYSPIVAAVDASTTTATLKFNRKRGQSVRFVTTCPV